jgi:threonylcarbamoyladenosine tRNA methylthiotransferase MtaB
MTPPMRVAFTNLGCKLNQAELEELARRFAAAGHRVVGSITEADLHVVNSCTVTHGAARDSRKTARRGARLNPAVRTILTGCYVESDRDEAARLEGVDLVVSNADKDDLVDRVHAAFPDLRPAVSSGGEVEVPYVPLEFGNSRALVKIEDGCNMQCSFCIIPATRGRQRSREPEPILDDVRQLAAAGFQEVVVTGVQISSYRAGAVGLYELTARLLDETDVRRLRLTSIAPWEFDLRLLDLFVADRLCRHFHLSLQSGCDATLRRMRRPYTAGQYADLVAVIRQRLPRVAITTDVIVGFPGETDEEFEASLAFAESQRFARLHAFPYSERPGTAAASMPAKVERSTIRTRMERMLTVSRAAETDFARRQIGQMASVLFETRRDDVWRGTSDNYLRVDLASDENLERRLAATRLIAADGPVLVGQVAG